MNIKINLPSIKDELFRSKTSGEVSSLTGRACSLRDTVQAFVSKNLA